MKINPLHYILGIILQISYLAACVFITIHLDYPPNQNPLLLVLYVAIGLNILLLLASKKFSVALGFITGLFTILLFWAMIVIELIIHPPSEE